MPPILNTPGLRIDWTRAASSNKDDSIVVHVHDLWLLFGVTVDPEAFQNFNSPPSSGFSWGYVDFRVVRVRDGRIFRNTYSFTSLPATAYEWRLYSEDAAQAGIDEGGLFLFRPFMFMLRRPKNNGPYVFDFALADEHVCWSLADSVF